MSHLRSLYRLFVIPTGLMMMHCRFNHRSSWPEHPLGGFPRAVADGDGVSVLLHSEVNGPDIDVDTMMRSGLSNGLEKASKGLSRRRRPS